MTVPGCQAAYSDEGIIWSTHKQQWDDFSQAQQAPKEVAALLVQTCAHEHTCAQTQTRT